MQNTVCDDAFAAVLQEKRRAERAEQQRIRAEKDKERQARREVCGFIFIYYCSSLGALLFFFLPVIMNR